MLIPENRNNKARAEAMYAESISPRFGFTPRSQIDLAGIQSVLQLREAAGLMKAPLPNPRNTSKSDFIKRAGNFRPVIGGATSFFYQNVSIGGYIFSVTSAFER